MWLILSLQRAPVAPVFPADEPLSLRSGETLARFDAAGVHLDGWSSVRTRPRGDLELTARVGGADDGQQILGGLASGGSSYTALHAFDARGRCGCSRMARTSACSS